MKLKQMDNYVKFIETVQRCEGDVYFCTVEGDELDLRSQFCQVLFASICGDRLFLEKGRITCNVESDYQRLGEYLTAKEE